MRRTESRGATAPTITMGMPAACTSVSRPAGSPGRGIATGPWSPTAMCSSLGASASMWDGLLVAHVAAGEPKKPFT